MTEQTDSKVPKIQFKGFVGDWEEKALGDLFPVTSAARVHKNEWTKSGVPFFRSSDVVSHFKGNENTKAFISHELYQELSAKVGRIKKGDMLVTGGGSIGIPYLVKTDEPLYFKDADLLWFKIREAVDSHYLYTFFSSEPFRRYLRSISHIGTIAHYTVEQAKSTPLRLPKKPPEQTKIGGYFRELDRLIGLHQRKHDKLVTLKKAMLQKMFPQAGATTPEVRFKGFSEPWKGIKLGAVGETQSGIGFSDAEQGGKTGTPFFKVSDMNLAGNELEMFTSNNYVSEEQLKRKGWNPISNVPAVIFAKVGAALMLNRKRLINQPFLIDNNLMAYLFGASWDTDFGRALFETINLPLYAQVGALPSYNGSDIESITVQLPGKGEQQKIGTYFRQLDELISKHAIQLQKLQQIKSACLEKMFA